MLGLLLIVYASITAMITLIISVLTGLSLSSTALSLLVIGGVVGGISPLVLTLAFILIYTTDFFDIARGGGKKVNIKGNSTTVYVLCYECCHVSWFGLHISYLTF